MKTALTFALLLVVGQAIAADQIISVQHDSARGVTCWIVMNTGISCLPDSSLLQQTTPSSEAARASQASSLAEISALQAAPLPQEKGLKL
ncbi:hypothetical protein JFT37_06045 [Pseudomonas fluorescens]|nr:hypothetical protein [Pseudomonas fluorescens]